MNNLVIDNIRSSLGRTIQSPLSLRPEIYGPRLPESVDSEVARFLDEIKKLSGVGQKLFSVGITSALKSLVAEQNIHKATVWNTVHLKQLGIADTLQTLGVEIVSSNADKHEIAQCDLGITEADYLLPETGTLVLRFLLRSRVQFLLCRVCTWQLSALKCCAQICIKCLRKLKIAITWCLSLVPAELRISS